MPGVQGLFTPLLHSDFTVGDKIGNGNFKKVCKGTFNARGSQEIRDVVVLRYQKGARLRERREIELLSYLAGIPDSREFVPEVVGACDEFRDSLILQERASLGSLKMAISEGSSVAELISPMHRMYMAIQISFAIDFLGRHRIVHADLACRNCLLFVLDEENPENTLVKVTDFGLAMQLPKGSTDIVLDEQQPHAVRWCAPEQLSHLVLSFATDAWSLGVTLWELFSGGRSPWVQTEKRAEVSAILRAMGQVGFEVQHVQQMQGPGAKPWLGIDAEFPQPEDCPDAAHNIILSCLRPESSRASVVEVGKAFERTVQVVLNDDAPVPEELVALAPEEEEEALTPQVPAVTRQLVFKSQALTKPESVEMITSNPKVLAFVEWLPTRRVHLQELFAKDSHDPSGGVFKDVSLQGSRGLSRERWAEVLRTLDYRGDTDAVFDVIADEAVGDRLKSSPVPLPPALGCEEFITLPQLKRFIQRAEAATASLTAGDEGSIVNRYARHLRQTRGSVLRAWYSDIDCRKAGRVAYVDFTNACRKFGYAAQCRLIWDCMRPDGGTAPLEFRELAPDEAAELEVLADLMLSSYGFNTNLVWQDLDARNQKYASLQDFIDWLAMIGFEGNAKRIYRALDSSGVGRMRRDDFDYIRKVSTKRHIAQGPFADLAMWAKATSQEPAEIIASMGIPENQTEIAVNDLAARLTAVGFDGDALQVSSRAARSSGGARVSLTLFRQWLSGSERPSHPSGEPLGGTLRRSTNQGSRTSLTMRKAPPRSAHELETGWNDSVDNISKNNMSKCSSSRLYFSAPPRRGMALDIAPDLGFAEDVEVIDGGTRQLSSSSRVVRERERR